MLPARLADRPDPATVQRPSTPGTDRGDASGTGYWPPARRRLPARPPPAAFGSDSTCRDVLGAGRGRRAHGTGWSSAAGTGDNMGAALGPRPRPGDVVVSLGTSGTVFARARRRRSADPTGASRASPTPTGRPPPARLHAQRGAGARRPRPRMLGTDLAGLDRLALAGAARAPVASPCCPTSTASAPPTCPTPPARWAG